MATPRLHPSLLLAAIGAAFAPASTLASGFMVQDQSASTLVNGHAGMAAALDASVAYTNPAAATQFDEAQWSVNVGGISLAADFADRGSLSAVGTPASGPARASADGAAPLLSLFYVRPLNDRVHLAFSMHTPFGLSTSYDEDWVGRYQVTTAELKTLALNPSLAFELNDHWSAAIGVSAVYAEAMLESAVDFGSLCFAVVGVDGCAAAQILPQTRDGQVEIVADDWGFGANAALFGRVGERTQVGLAWRGRVALNHTGEARFHNPQLPGPFAALTQTVATQDGPVRAPLDLPASLTFGLDHRLTEATHLVADLSWTDWSTLQDIRIDYANGAAATVVDFSWEDTLKLGLGINHRLNDQWLLRTGLEFEESAVSDARRNPVVPDSRRVFAAIGARRTLSDRSSLDLGLGRLRFARSDIDRAVLGAGRLVGDYALDSWHLGLQYNRAIR